MEYLITVHAAKASTYGGDVECVSYDPLGLDGTKRTQRLTADNFDALHEAINAYLATLADVPLAVDPAASANAVDVFAVIVSVPRGQRKPRGFNGAFGEMITVPRKEVTTS